MPSREPLKLVRVFIRGYEIPQQNLGAYGVAALRQQPTPDSKDRLLMFCRAFLTSLPPQSSLGGTVPPENQMVTFWPVDNPEAPPVLHDDCDYLTSHYDLNGGVTAVSDASQQGHRLDGRGPFLIGWSPSKLRGRPDEVVLILDLSLMETQDDFSESFRLWQNEIIEKPDLWRNGFTLEGLRVAVKNFSDKYGSRILESLKFWKL
ncbi:MAG: hypothetical protein WDN49_27735 [Acetobacteraceae bacterium]